MEREHPLRDGRGLDLARRRADEGGDRVGHRHHLVEPDPPSVAGLTALDAADGAVEEHLPVRRRDAVALALLLVRAVGLGARLAEPACEPLGDEAVDRGRDDAAVDVHVDEPLHRRRGGLRVEGGEDEVARHRGAEGDLRRLLVTDLADEDDVGVGAEDRAQAVREREARAGVDLDLVEPGGAVLDRVLERDDRHLRPVQLLERRVERRRLARARRADDDDRAERLLDRMAQRLLAPRPHPERGERGGSLALREDAQRRLLAVRGREDGDADVDRLLPALHRDAAVLRRAALGDVEAAHDLEPARDRLRLGAGDRADLAHHAVDPGARDEPLALGREVDVGGADVEGLGDRAVDEDDGRRVVLAVDRRRVVDHLGCELVDLDELDHRAVEVTRDRELDLILGCDRDAHRDPERQPQLVGEHRRWSGSATATSTAPSLLQPHRDRVVPTRELLGEQTGRLRLDRVGGELEERQLVLLGEHGGDLAERRGSLLDEDLPESSLRA